MRRHHRFIWVLGLLAGLAVATCSFPTDKSDEVYVVLTPSDTLLARGIIGQGQTDLIFAQTWRRLPNGDSAEVLNVDYMWSSDNESVARVERRSGGFAEVTGVNVGTVAIRAKAAAFDKSIDATVPVRVSPSFIIDSVRPLNVAFGDKVSVFGVRVNQIFFMDQGFGSLIPDEFSFTGSLEGLGRLDFWVPFPSSSGHPFYFGPGVFGSTTDSVDIASHYDAFEPNYALPSMVDINGAGGPRTLSGDPVLFYNPALYYEPYDAANDGPFPIDWYRFARADTTSAVTYIVNSQVFDDTAFLYVTDSFYFNGGNYTIGDGAGFGWLNTPGLGLYECDGQGFFSSREQRTPTTYVALRTLPGKAVHVVSNYGKDGPYSVAVVKGYQTQDRRIGPDRFEENDNWCRYANENFNNSTDSTSPNRKHLVIGNLTIFGQNGPWADSTLTIDNAHDIDWYRFRVQPNIFTGDTVVIIRSKARPFSFFDFSDIDLYVVRASDMSYMATSTNVGSNDSMRLNLPPGDYFLGVVDAAGTPTRYALCIAKGGPAVPCTPPGSAVSAQIAPSVYRIPTLAPPAQRARAAKLLFTGPR
jgi:hypothetical protein